MNYDFPIIKHLDDVRPAIEGRDEFIIAERDWGYVVNYMVSMTDTFPPVLDNEYWCPGCKIPVSETEGCGSQRCPEAVNLAAIRRECRGLIFCKETGKITRRPFHKFFNVNERDETQIGRLDFSLPHSVNTKLDGSMISPFEVTHGSGIIRFGTKMGITEVAMQAEEFVAKNMKYMEFSKWCIKNNLTPIFEWTSRQQRIVIDYPVDNLTLLAVRHMITGEFLRL